jgi:hypothetical protein
MLKFVIAVPDCSQPMSPFQILWSPCYPQKPAPIVIRITVPGASQPANSDGGLAPVSRGIRPIPYYPWRHLTLLINPWSGQAGYGSGATY